MADQKPFNPQKRLEAYHMWFAVSSIAMLALFLLLAYQDYDREWKKYQADFQKLELSKATDAAGRASVKKRGIDLQRSWLPDLVVQPADSRGVPDRCITCHQGILRPAFADAPQPYRSHPGLTTWFKKHNVDAIGCVTCHEGQGPATDVHAAHGPVEHWLEPMLRGKNIQASCMKCHTLNDETAAPGLETIRKGREIAEKFKCTICHKVMDEGGSVGPELTDVYKKVDTSTGILHEIEWQKKHFKNPRATSNDTSAMPNFLFNDEDLEALMTYVLALNTKRVNADQWAPSLVAAKGQAIRPHPALTIPPLPPLGREDSKQGMKAAPLPADEFQKTRAEYIAEGKKQYETLGCTACHSINTDPHHVDKGKIGPDFVNLAGGDREEAFIADLLTSPTKYSPAAPMPPYPGLSLKQRRQIALYLLSPKVGAKADELTGMSKVLRDLIGYKKAASKS